MSLIEKTEGLRAVQISDEDIPTYDARDLIRDGVQARIMLDRQTYTLRITRAGKLILTK